MIRPYIFLSKPGIIAGNVFAGIAGFIFASYSTKAGFDGALFLASMTGLACIIASACSFNNVIDLDIDSIMSRTQRRVLVTGVLTPKQALVYGTIIGLIGFALLLFYSSLIAFAIGVFAWIAYVVIYSYYGKRTKNGTFLGVFSGAIPPVLGYCAVTDYISLPAILLFVIYAIWQMPHSYAIAVFRGDDYQKANIPVLPLVVGFDKARLNMARHIARFTLSVGTFAYMYMHQLSFALLLGLSAWWLYVCIYQYTPENSDKWGRKVFHGSLILSVGLNILMMVDHLFKQYL